MDGRTNNSESLFQLSIIQSHCFRVTVSTFTVTVSTFTVTVSTFNNSESLFQL